VSQKIWLKKSGYRLGYDAALSVSDNLFINALDVNFASLRLRHRFSALPASAIRADSAASMMARAEKQNWPEANPYDCEDKAQDAHRESAPPRFHRSGLPGTGPIDQIRGNSCTFVNAVVPEEDSKNPS
jgi:hypothetical protein